VNLASRLEGVSGHSRIIIGEATFRDLEKHDIELGALCVELEPVTPKGFSTPIRIWEVPWKSFLPPGSEVSLAAGHG
jgi:class 3 adenylate cyclase